MEADCLLWGMRVVVSENLRKRVSNKLHLTHSGMSQMKSLVRSNVWWHGLDKAIKDLVKTCSACQQTQSLLAKAPLHAWEWSVHPCQRLHLDCKGPFLDKMYLLVIVAHSKWPRVFIMTSATSAKAIELLRTLFSSYGLPEQLVTVLRILMK